ncbi:MAG: 50S ribosomal protein L35 [Paenibacillaceae bacterium]|jgi:large subunit ribosomal protein L35|nr:50S ribosomal protein L35 [Paenibacillaceae bacterium]
MPKMKTKSALKGRFKITGTGKVLRFKAYKRHLLTGKTSRQKRDLSTQTVVHSGDVKRLKQLLRPLR